MSYLTTDDLLDARISMLKSKFPDVLLEFSKRVFDDHLELWVYVMTLTRFDDVKAYCEQEIEPLKIEPNIPIWIFTKTWSGPWPGGESEQEIKTRRETFRERLERRLRHV